MSYRNLSEIPPLESYIECKTQIAIDPGKDGGIAVRYPGKNVIA